MTSPIVNLNELEMRQEYTVLREQLIKDPDAYRERYNQLYEKAIKIIRGLGYNSTASNRMANKTCIKFIEHQYEQDGHQYGTGIYDLDALEKYLDEELVEDFNSDPPAWLEAHW